MSNKTLLIDAIIGKGFSTIDYAIKMEKAGLAYFTGNQWNEKWNWNKFKLEDMTEEELKNIYYND